MKKSFRETVELAVRPTERQHMGRGGGVASTTGGGASIGGEQIGAALGVLLLIFGIYVLRQYLAHRERLAKQAVVAAAADAIMVSYETQFPSFATARAAILRRGGTNVRLAAENSEEIAAEASASRQAQLVHVEENLEEEERIKRVEPKPPVDYRGSLFAALVLSAFGSFFLLGALLPSLWSCQRRMLGPLVSGESEPSGGRVSLQLVALGMLGGAALVAKLGGTLLSASGRAVGPAGLAMLCATGSVGGVMYAAVPAVARVLSLAMPSVAAAIEQSGLAELVARAGGDASSPGGEASGGMRVVVLVSSLGLMGLAGALPSLLEAYAARVLAEAAAEAGSAFQPPPPEGVPAGRAQGSPPSRETALQGWCNAQSRVSLVGGVLGTAAAYVLAHAEPQAAEAAEAAEAAVADASWRAAVDGCALPALFVAIVYAAIAVSLCYCTLLQPPPRRMNVAPVEPTGAVGWQARARCACVPCALTLEAALALLIGLAVHSLLPALPLLVQTVYGGPPTSTALLLLSLASAALLTSLAGGALCRSNASLAPYLLVISAALLVLHLVPTLLQGASTLIGGGHGEASPLLPPHVMLIVWLAPLVVSGAIMRPAALTALALSPHAAFETTLHRCFVLMNATSALVGPLYLALFVDSGGGGGSMAVDVLSVVAWSRALLVAPALLLLFAFPLRAWHRWHGPRLVPYAQLTDADMSA